MQMFCVDLYLTQLSPATLALSMSVVICSRQSIRLHLIWFGGSGHAPVVVHARPIHLLVVHSLSFIIIMWFTIRVEKKFQTSLILSQNIEAHH